MAINWEQSLNQLQQDVNVGAASTQPLAQEFTDASRDRLNLVQNLQGAAGNPTWMAELDNLLNSTFAQNDRAIQGSWAAGQGQQVANQAGRGLLGSSFDAQGRAGLQAAREGSRQQAARSVEQTRADALYGREAEIDNLIRAIMQEDGNIGAAGQQLIGNLANTGDAQAASAGLNADLANANSEMWGGILTNLGQAGASGIRWADRENQNNWTWNRTNPDGTQRKTDNSWFGGF